MESSKPKIKILKGGPYLVSGNIPLQEKIIDPAGEHYSYKDGRTFSVPETYSLCRCGHSKNMPFCDGSHAENPHDCTEKNDRTPYTENAVLYEGPALLLTDREDLCAFARFCHAKEGNVWEFVRHSDNPKFREIAIQEACDCPAGRLIVYDKGTNEPIEPEFSPSIVLLQDPAKGVSGPLWVRGYIPIEGADGHLYEIRNRVTLCRCGKSRNTPFCDATHISSGFIDQL